MCLKKIKQVWFWSETGYNWKRLATRQCVYIHLCAAFSVFNITWKLSLLSSPFSPWLCDPFLRVISPGLEKQSIQSSPREEGGKEKRDLRGNLSRSCWAMREKKEQSRGPAFISLSSHSFMSSKLFQRPELLCLCCALKSLAGLYEERQWEHLEKATKGAAGGGRKKKWMAPLIKLSKLSHWPAVEINSKQGAPASQVMNILQTAHRGDGGGWRGGTQIGPSWCGWHWKLQRTEQFCHFSFVCKFACYTN